MNNIQNSLYGLFDTQGVSLSKEYKDCIEKYLVSDLSFTSEMMNGLARTIFQNKKMMAYYLLHNAIDEAKGAARLRMIAERYADDELRPLMLRHYNDEMNHSTLFASLIPLTGYETETHEHEVQYELDKVMNFDDELKTFLFRVHSIEIRSWRLLLLHLAIIDESDDDYMKQMRPTIQKILEDEMQHVCYTGKYVSRWLHAEPHLSKVFVECITHTNKETWEDLSSMALFMRDHIQDFLLESAA